MISRILLLIGLGIGLVSWTENIGHIGSSDFLVPDYAQGPTHSWYHVFREVCGDVAKMAVFLLVFFGGSRWRIPVTWWIALILIVGYYAPFWIGAPFSTGLAVPNKIAGVIHILMALFTCAALAVARPAFQSAKDVADD